jgi:hypothetical protein
VKRHDVFAVMTEKAAIVGENPGATLVANLYRSALGRLAELLSSQLKTF